MKIYEPKKQLTLDCLFEMEGFLRKYGVGKWASVFSHHRKILERSFTIENIQNALNTFSCGMGSFNDLIICKKNGHSIKIHEEQDVWKELKELRAKVSQNLSEIKNAL